MDPSRVAANSKRLQDLTKTNLSSSALVRIEEILLKANHLDITKLMQE